MKSLTWVPVDLLLGDDNLGAEGVFGVGHGVVQQTDGPDHLAHLLNK